MPFVFSNISGIFFTLLLHNSKKCSNFAVAKQLHTRLASKHTVAHRRKTGGHIIKSVY